MELLFHKLFPYFPVVYQQSMMDCGPACLATICRYHGKHVSLNQLRDLARVGQSGASMLNLLKTANVLGYETEAILEIFDNLVAKPLPAIVNWGGNHWIVVYKATPEQVIVADPAQGLRYLPTEEFLEGWTRYTLYLYPTARIRDIEESKPSLKKFGSYLQPHTRLLVEVLMVSGLIQLLGMLLPLFTKFILDEVIVGQQQQWLTYSLMAVFALVLLNLWLGFSRQQLLLFVTLRVNLLMVTDFYQHVLALPLTFFEARKVGDITSRFQETQKISNFLTHIGLQSLLDLLAAVMYLGLMFYFNWSLTLVAGLFLILHIINIYIITPRLQRTYRDVFQKGADAQSYLIESLSGLNTIKSLGIERLTRWQVEDRYVRFTNAYLKTINLGIFSSLSSGLVNNLSDAAVLGYGSILVIQNQLSVGALIAFTALTHGLTAPVTCLVGMWNTLQETLNAVERLNDVFETKPELNVRDARDQIELPTLRGHVCLDRLTFRYEPESKTNVLQNISLEIQPGQHIAVVGRSGSGKSTLIKLLLGLYPATAGQIYFDGFDLRDIWLPSLRAQIGVVPQRSQLFRGTILENICADHQGVTLDRAISAAQCAAAHDFISQLPQGYQTIVAEQGTNLSGGQQQRIAIARALVRNPRVLILDEATSALDNVTEKIVMENINAAFPFCTILTIAHRLSTVQNADLIVVLESGNILEQGNHEQLMARCGLYYHLTTGML